MMCMHLVEPCVFFCLLSNLYFYFLFVPNPPIAITFDCLLNLMHKAIQLSFTMQIYSNRYLLSWFINSNICSVPITSKSNLRFRSMWLKTFQYMHNRVHFKYWNYEIGSLDREILKMNRKKNQMKARNVFVFWVDIFSLTFSHFPPTIWWFSA